MVNFDNRRDINDPTEDKDEQYYCPECEAPVKTENTTCSRRCHESAMR